MLAACVGALCGLRDRWGCGATATTDRDHALEWLRPADGLHGWNWSTGVVKPSASCGPGALTLAFNQGNTPPPAAVSRNGGVGTAGSALLSAWSARSVPDGARVGYLLTAPPGITINNVSVTAEHLQNIANGRGWIGLTYWNGGTAQVLPDGTAVDAAASGPLDTAYWGIELRCVEAECVWPGETRAQQSHRVRGRGAGAEHRARCRPRKLVEPCRGRRVGLERAG